MEQSRRADIALEAKRLASILSRGVEGLERSEIWLDRTASKTRPTEILQEGSHTIPRGAIESVRVTVR